MKRPIAHLLVPIDGSKHSLTTLEHALDLAKQLQARVTVQQVVEPVLYPGFPATTDGDFVTEAANLRFEKAQILLNAAGVEWIRAIDEGYAADRICQRAETDEVDIIVIGSHGSSAVERFLFGSVADRVVHHAPCDVLVVR